MPFNTCPGGVCPTLSYNTTTGKYGYSGPAVDFVRKIQSPAIGGGGNETRDSSPVTWTPKAGTLSLPFSENLYNWVEANVNGL